MVLFIQPFFLSQMRIFENVDRKAIKTGFSSTTFFFWLVVVVEKATKILFR